MDYTRAGGVSRVGLRGKRRERVGLWFLQDK